MRYDPIMCMMVDDSVKTQDELSLSQKKQVVTELNGFLKKSYNFSDESEYARAYEDLRHMFTTGSRKSISGLFENAVKKTGAHDSVKTKDVNKNEGYKIHKAEIRGDKLYLTYTDLLYGGKETESFTKSEAKGFLTDPWNTWEGNTKSVMMKFVKDSKTIDKAIRSCDEQIRLVKTISKKNGYAIHIVERGFGEQIVLTFPNESYDNPHMWLGPNNSSNIQRAKGLLDAFSK